MTAETTHHWPVPPPDGYTVDDLLTLPDLPPHTELLDGSLVFVSPQRFFHSVVVDSLVSGLRSTAPPELTVAREMTVLIDERNGPEPDITVVRAAAVRHSDQTHFQVRDVLLAVEVVSPESEARDRDTKPHKYANAGIPYFWRVEKARPGGHPVVQVFDLDREDRIYRLADTFRERLKLGTPFDIDIDLAAIALP
ncbi:Uma2 family endonuclease [Streptomyces sp. NPDC017529]|uniref:Uma2 family endonuclease n=1 Tax=Streptomyces sp. NPDC017529 TaxID=3365000 RepID=UPI00379C3651